jgi:sodium/potassium/calcium exchanger 6
MISVPLAFLRDCTCPMVEIEAWNKFRAAVLPLTIPFSFAFLTGKFDLNTKDYREV